MMNRVLVLLAILCACGEVKAPMATDATPEDDALAGGDGLSFAPATFAFGDVGIGSASEIAVFELSASADSPAFALRLVGTGAAQFALVDSTCSTSLPRGASCEVRIAMTPTAAGAHAAELVVEGATDARLASLALSGSGVASTLSVMPSVSSFGDVTIGMSMDRTFTIHNTGTVQVQAPTITLDDNAFIHTSSCAAVLGPQDSCAVNVRFAPTSVGARSTSLVAQTGGVMTMAQLSGIGGSTLMVTRTGPGKVLGPGIDCGTDCEARVTSSPIQLQAVAPAGARFMGWGPGTPSCGLAATCSVGIDVGSKNVFATFADIPTLQLTVNNADPAGSAIALGYVTVSPPNDTCGGNATAVETCTYDLVDSVVTLTARNECSSFAGWGGACAGSGTSCTVDLTADTSVSASFNFATCQ